MKKISIVLTGVLSFLLLFGTTSFAETNSDTTNNDVSINQTQQQYKNKMGYRNGQGQYSNEDMKERHQAMMGNRYNADNSKGQFNNGNLKERQQGMMGKKGDYMNDNHSKMMENGKQMGKNDNHNFHHNSGFGLHAIFTTILVILLTVGAFFLGKNQSKTSRQNQEVKSNLEEKKE